MQKLTICRLQKNDRECSVAENSMHDGRGICGTRERERASERGK